MKEWEHEQVVDGELASKSNSRQLVTLGGKPRFIKSKKALEYERSFIEQSRYIGDPYESHVRLTAVIYYASRRPDLDDTLLCDCIERAGIIKNDRQIKEKHLYHRIDKNRPRVEFHISSLDYEEALINLGYMIEEMRKKGEPYVSTDKSGAEGGDQQAPREDNEERDQ